MTDKNKQYADLQFAIQKTEIEIDQLLREVRQLKKTYFNLINELDKYYDGYPRKYQKIPKERTGESKIDL